MPITVAKRTSVEVISASSVATARVIPSLPAPARACDAGSDASLPGDVRPDLSPDRAPLRTGGRRLPRLASGSPALVDGCVLQPATERGLYQPFRIWLQLHARDVLGFGGIEKREAIAYLIGLGFARSTVYNLLRQGEDVLWRQETIQRRARPGHHAGAARKILRLTGAQALARAWGLPRLSTWRAEVDPRDVVHYGDWNCQRDALRKPRRGSLRITKTGIKPPRPQKPIARVIIEANCGVSPRTQFNHEQVRLPSSGQPASVVSAPHFTSETVPVDLASSKRRHTQLGNSYDL